MHHLSYAYIKLSKIIMLTYIHFCFSVNRFFFFFVETLGPLHIYNLFTAAGYEPIALEKGTEPILKERVQATMFLGSNKEKARGSWEEKRRRIYVVAP